MAQYNLKYIRGVIDCQYSQLTSSIQARYMLSVDLNNKSNKVATFIMMNPSKADFNNSDLTVNKVIKFSFIKGKGSIGIINIVNLFPFYETHSGSLQAVIKQVKNMPNLIFKDIMTLNNEMIKQALQSSNYIVLAWGNPSDNIDKRLHFDQCKYINSYIRTLNNKKIYVIKTQFEKILTNEGYPRHPSRPSLQGFKKCLISEDGQIII